MLTESIGTHERYEGLELILYSCLLYPPRPVGVDKATALVFGTLDCSISRYNIMSYVETASSISGCSVEDDCSKADDFSTLSLV